MQFGFDSHSGNFFLTIFFSKFCFSLIRDNRTERVKETLLKIHCFRLTIIIIIIREGASHSLCRDGTRFFCFGGFDNPETHIRHVQNLILIAEMESAS